MTALRVLGCVLLVCWAGLVRASDADVVVVGARAPDDTTAEALARMSGELSAAGYRPVPWPAPPPERPIDDEMLAAARTFHPLAVLALVTKQGGRDAQLLVYFASSMPPRQESRSIVLDDVAHERVAAVLAVRSVETLRNLLSLLPVRTPAPPPPTQVARVAEPAPPAAIRAWQPYVALGGAALFGALDPAPMPTVRAGVSSARVGLGVLVGGLGPRTTVTAGADRASVAHTLGVVEGELALTEGRIVRPTIWTLAGVYRLAGQGAPGAGGVGRSDARHAFAAGGGLGIAVRASRVVDVGVRAAAVFTFPEPRVLLRAEDAGGAGRPAWLLDVHFTVRP